ncbi:MAG: LamG-like jellyroll fold domain-containing protein [Planctomycetota bacterium]|jgi:hypothetical protein
MNSECDNIKEKIADLVSGMLSESQVQTVEQHLKECTGCREYARALKHEDVLLTKFFAQIETDMTERQEQVVQAIDHSYVSEQSDTNAIWSTIMKNPLPKLAAAAVIIVATLILLNVIPTGNSVVWAEVLDNVNQAKAFAYFMRMNLAGMVEGGEDRELEAEIRVSAKQGMRIDSYRDGQLNSKMYLSTKEHRTVTVMPKEKTQLRMTVTDALFEKISRENGDPRKMVEKATKYYDTELGRRIINGIEVEGIACHDPIIAEGVLTGFAGGLVEGVVCRLWADTENYLPVMLEIEIFTSNNEKLIDIVTYEYQWNIEVDPNEFVPETEDEANVVITADEKSTLQGLEFFAKQTDGRYPTDLSEMTIGRELREALRVKFGGNAPWPDNQKIFFLQMAVRFYTGLVIEDKEPAYYGDKVTAEFPNAVLIRWREDDGLYKVIFGDLSTKELTAGQLAELEATPLNPKPIAVRPQPKDGAGGFITDVLELGWMPGADVTEHMVYFGTEPDALALLEEVSGSARIMTPALQTGVTYFWRVDEIQPDGSVAAGDVWSFDTGSLVGWWKLDEGSGDIAADSSGNGHDGSLQGNVSWADGVTGYALLFDEQGDYVDIGTGADFDIRNQITVCAWIMVDSFERQWQGIVTKGNTSWRLQRNYGKSTIEFACTGLNVPGAMFSHILGTIEVDDGQWHHAAGTYDGQKICLYIDGKVDVCSKASGRIHVDNQPVYIGENAEEPSRSWNGLIDEVRIYNYGLTSEEVVALCSQ